jgi:outer membrane protein assembly factor BamB
MKLKVAALAAVLTSTTVLPAASNWPQFRGPRASGVSDEPAPVTWNMETGENVRWQTPIPGLGHACPIIWNDRIYIATAVKPGDKPKLKVGLYGDVGSYTENVAHQWRLLCLNKATGEIIWDKLALEGVPHSKRHTKATQCNSTPATDGQRIVVLFGSEGMFCFDMDGKLLWRKDLGKLDAGWYVDTDTSWGFGSSPVLYDGKVLLQCDVLSQQFIAAYDAKDGHELWHTARKDVPTWSTPLVAESGGKPQVVASGYKEIAGYDVTTGKQLWRMNEGGDVPVASPITAKELVILTSGHGRYRPMRAVHLEAASGDITPAKIEATNNAVVWSHPRNGNYLATPISVGGLVWGDLDGIVTCFDVKTGEIYYNERIGGGSEGFTASAVSAGGKLYFTGEQGDVFVLPATKEFSVLATNSLGGLCLSTPAVSDGAIYFRTTEKLVAIGTKSK